jgi:hypothetical protein
MSNIFRIDQFKNFDAPVGSVKIIGPAASRSIPVKKTGYSIRLMDLLQAIASQLKGAFAEAKVHTIDTSPIADSKVLGLAKIDIHGDAHGYVDRESGKIYVDVEKIVNHVMNGMFPPNVQLPNEGASLDPDLKKSIAKKVYEAIAEQVADTVAHETHHKKRTILDIREGKPVDYNPESEAESAGKQFGQSFSAPSQF